MEIEYDFQHLIGDLEDKYLLLQKEKQQYYRCDRDLMIKDDRSREEDELLKEAGIILKGKHELKKKTEKIIQLLRDIQMVLDNCENQMNKEMEEMQLEDDKIIDQTNLSVDIVQKINERKGIKEKKRMQKIAEGILNDCNKTKEFMNQFIMTKTPAPFKPMRRKNDLKENVSQLLGMEIKSQLFDSSVDKWNKNDSDFGSKLIGNRNVCIVIEDKEGNIFGGFVSTEVGIERYHFDSHSLLFSIQKNHKETMKRYPLKHRAEDLFICENSSDVLFAFGAIDDTTGSYFKDICVHKHDCEVDNYCEQHSYNYHDEPNVLCGKKTFGVKQIIVFEMKEDEKMMKERQEREQHEYQMDLKRWKEDQPVIEETLQKMFDKQIKEVIFDSEINNWSVGDSSFDVIIEGKENLIVLVEDERNNLFGGYIGCQVKVGKVTDDDECCLFRLKQDGEFNPCAFPQSQGHTFYVFPQSEKYLIVFGLTEGEHYHKDLAIKKKDCGGGYCKQYAFDYYDTEHALCGKVRFNVKRVVVYQMEEPPSIFDSNDSNDTEQMEE